MSNLILIGIKDNKIATAKETILEINKVKNYKLDVVDSFEEIVKWDDLDNYKNKNTIFRAIVYDRKLRDKGEIMADRPNFCAITVEKNIIKRIEYYEGHDELNLLYDIRAKEYIGKSLERYMEKDKAGYDFDLNFIVLDETYYLNEHKFKEDYREEFKKIYQEIHKEVLLCKINKSCKYHARLSQTLQQHNYEFQIAAYSIFSLL